MSTPTATVALPKIMLKNMRVSPDILSIIPLETVEKYQVAAFASEAATLKLAIVYPEQLKQGFYVALQDLGKKVGKSIQLFQTDAASMQWLIQQYKQGKNEPAEKKETVSLPIPSPAPIANTTPPVIPEIPKPPLFELGKSVAYNYLKRVPLEFAQAHRIACVDYLPPNIYWFCLTKDPKLRHEQTELLSFLETQNHIKAYPIEVADKDLNDLLGYYASIDKVEHKKEVDQPAHGHKESAMAIEPEKELAEGVIMPDLQATILSSEQEKGGIAGIFQKMAQGFGGEKEGEQKTPEPKETASPTSVPLPAAPTSATPSPTPSQPAPQPAAPASATPSSGPVPSKSAAPAKAPTTPEIDTEIGKLLEKSVDSLDELKEYVKKGFVPQIVAAVVSFAIHEKASDIHLESFEDEVRVRYRVDGQLLDIVKLPPDIHAAMVSRIKILSRLRLDETRVPQDGRFDVNFHDTQVDLRVSVMPTVHGEKVVMRILDKSKGISSLEKLGIEGLGYENLTKAINRPFGVCLTTGPTGSGKSTSLYAILNRIATPNVNVVTLEDPVEYEMKGINQSQIRPKIGFTFAEGLRAILRQDPNIIMVGEIRDGETANMATQAALTGHLVLSTLHTNDAAGAIPRLMNMGIEPFLITSSLNVVVGQRLVRKICQDCKSEVNLPQGIKDQIAHDLDIITHLNPNDAARVKKPFNFYQGKGCPVCEGKGYRGRVGIYEVLTMSDALEELTIQRASATTIQDQAQKEGMLTMYQDGLLKVIAGLTTLDEVLRETTNK